jgi:hypothetical protein
MFNVRNEYTGQIEEEALFFRIVFSPFWIPGLVIGYIWGNLKSGYALGKALSDWY